MASPARVRAWESGRNRMRGVGEPVRREYKGVEKRH